MVDFFKRFETMSCNSKDRYGTVLIQFYRMMFDLKRKERPRILEWFNYITKKQKRRIEKPDKENFIFTSEEYQRLIQVSTDELSKWKAL